MHRIGVADLEGRVGLVSVGSRSPDGSWYWDGATWRSALSGDGLWRWDGTARPDREPRVEIPQAILMQPTSVRIGLAAWGRTS